MVRHWLETPVNGYLGSDYGQEAKAMLQQPQADSSVANAFLQKLRRDVEILQALPAGAVNLYSTATPPDSVQVNIVVAGQSIKVTEK